MLVSLPKKADRLFRAARGSDRYRYRNRYRYRKYD
jgi:hypothetical protein